MEYKKIHPKVSKEMPQAVENMPNMKYLNWGKRYELYQALKLDRTRSGLFYGMVWFGFICGLVWFGLRA